MRIYATRVTAPIRTIMIYLLSSASWAFFLAACLLC